MVEMGQQMTHSPCAAPPPKNNSPSNRSQKPPMSKTNQKTLLIQTKIQLSLFEELARKGNNSKKKKKRPETQTYKQDQNDSTCNMKAPQTQPMLTIPTTPRPEVIFTTKTKMEEHNASVEETRGPNKKATAKQRETVVCKLQEADENFVAIESCRPREESF